MFENVYRNKKVLITGNTGFKGCWLSTWLLELGSEVYGLSRKSDSKVSFYNELKLAGKIHQIEADITNLEQVAKSIKEIKPDFVFHLAAQAIVSSSFENPVETLKVNSVGTAHVLEAMRLSDHPCIGLFITTDKCYENQEWIWGYRENDRLGGRDPYSASKSLAEIIIKSYHYSFFSKTDSKIKICSLRSGNLIGGGDWSKDRIVPDCIKAWNNNKTIDIRSPHSTRPWQHVLDTLNGYLVTGQYLLKNPELIGEAFNFGPDSEGEHTVLELVEELIKYSDFPKNFKFYNAGDREKTFKEGYFLKLNCDKASKLLNWKPVLGFSESVRFTADWYSRYYKKTENPVRITQEQINSFSIKCLGN